MKTIESIFRQSPANGAEYRDPPEQRWQWPTETFLQRRRAWLAGGGHDPIDDLPDLPTPDEVRKLRGKS